MSRTINVNTLDYTSVEQAKRELWDYHRWLLRKADELRDKVADLIASYADAGFNSSPADSTLLGGMRIGTVDVQVTHSMKIAVVMAIGEDAVWIEFGAGVYYNTAAGTSPNPLVMQNGLEFNIGSYSLYDPNKTTWFFYDENGDKQGTHGTPASMPFYRAITTVATDIAAIAKGVFSTP